MRALYYSPELRRFVNADILAGDITNAVALNRYAYANTNPVFMIDPWGLSAEINRGVSYAAYRMVHLVAKSQSSCPEMYENTYVQHIGLPLGQYGANGVSEPANMVFDERADKRVAEVLCDRDAKVIYIER